MRTVPAAYQLHEIAMPKAKHDDDRSVFDYIGEFKDDGCKESPSCLACPLVKCVEDMTFTERERWKTRTRDREKVQEFTEALKSMPRLAAEKIVAARHGINARTVRRMLERSQGIHRTN